MPPYPITTILMLTQDAENVSAFILYVSIFGSLISLGYLWYYFFYSKRNPIQLRVPIYPFFQSAGRTATEMVQTSNDKDTSSLLAYLINMAQLTSTEFEEMVGEALKRRGCSDMQNIAHESNKGWEITGVDKKGQLTYIRVIYSDKKIERSIVEKFHSAKATGKSRRAIIATNSTFTEQAGKYALEVNIELLGGQELRELCYAFIDDAPHSDKLTRPINRASLELDLQQFIDQAIFSFPNPPSTFISDTKMSPITFSPLQFYQFKLWKQFANSTRSWIWNLNFPDHLLVNHPTQKWHVVENRQQTVTMDLGPLTKHLEKEGLQFSINPAPQIKKLSTVKEIVQQTTSTEQSYKDGNNQQCNQVCTAQLSDIEILTSATFWGSMVDFKVKIGHDSTIELRLHEGKVSQILSQNENLGETLLDKTTILCQDCQKLAAPAKYFRNLTYCPGCGKVLCEDCGNWCSDCLTQITAGEKEKKKNPEAIKKLKKTFQEWQMDQDSNEGQ